jgi:hypothetical protein
MKINWFQAKIRCLTNNRFEYNSHPCCRSLFVALIPIGSIRSASSMGDRAERHERGLRAGRGAQLPGRRLPRAKRDVAKSRWQQPRRIQGFFVRAQREILQKWLARVHPHWQGERGPVRVRGQERNWHRRQQSRLPQSQW